MTRTSTVRPPSPASAVRRRLTAVAVALAVVVGLGGCSAAETGAAAVVDGRRISVSDVQSATVDLRTYTGQSLTEQQVLYYLVLAPFLTDAAAQNGVGVSAADARGELVQKIPAPSDASIEVLRAAEAASRLSQIPEDRGVPIRDELVDRVRAATIDLSPRYGEFDAEQLTIAPPTEDWIKATDATATP